jgi:hypothetical protein
MSETADVTVDAAAADSREGDVGRAAPVEGAAPQGTLPSPRLQDLLDLFTRPRRFFGRRLDLGAGLPFSLTAMVVGVSAYVDRVDLAILRSSLNTDADAGQPMALIGTTGWPVFWLLALILGAVSAFFFYWIGGWWYGVRLRFSGAGKALDWRLARLVNIWMNLVQALPHMLLTLGFTFVYPNYIAAYNSTDLVSSFLPIMLLWSIAVSYVAVRENFNVTPWKAQLWFLYLPTAFVVVLMGGVLAGMKALG